MKRRYNKYNVAPAEDRRWRGKTYPSKGEMLYAQQLDLYLMNGDYHVVIEQPKRRWGEFGEMTYTPDFFVAPKDQAPMFIDYKGKDTKEFRRAVKLWQLHEPLNLWVVRGRPGKYKTEVIHGTAHTTGPAAA